MPTEDCKCDHMEGHLVTSSSSGLPEYIYPSAPLLLSWCAVIHLFARLFLPLLECAFFWGRDQILDMVSGPSSVCSWNIINVCILHVWTNSFIRSFIHLFIHYPMSVVNFHYITLSLVRPVTEVRDFEKAVALLWLSSLVYETGQRNLLPQLPCHSCKGCWLLTFVSLSGDSEQAVEKRDPSDTVKRVLTPSGAAALSPSQIYHVLDRRQGTGLFLSLSFGYFIWEMGTV